MTVASTPAAAAGRLSSQLSACLNEDSDWDLALFRLAGGEAGLHLAVLLEPFCSWLLDGTKTIEPGSPACAAPPTAPCPKEGWSW